MISGSDLTEHEIDVLAPLRPEDFGIGQLFWVIRDAVIVGEAASGRIVLWNPAAEQLFGYTAAEVLGEPIDLLVPDSLKERHRAGLALFAATGHGAIVDAGDPVELPALHKSGDTILVELTLTPIVHSIVPGTCVLAIVRDATERKRAEAERLALAREQAARVEVEVALQLRDQFLSIASHELRNPVTVLKAAADLLLRIPDDASRAERQSRLLMQITRAADGLATLTDDLLDVSRFQQGQLPLRLEEVDLSTVVRDIGSRYQEQLDDQSRLVLEAPAGSVPVLADPVRLEQVLLNLLDNAVKYSPDGGSITLALRPEESGVRLSLRDEGIGLPKEAIESIFEPFARGANTDGIPGMKGLCASRQRVEDEGDGPFRLLTVGA